MKALLLATVIVSATLISCGSTSRTKQGTGGDGGDGASMGAMPSGEDPCAGSLKRLGARYDEGRACVEATEQVETGCNGEPGQGGYYCVERKDDGAKFWVISIDGLAIDESVWGSCSPGRSTLPPPPCFAAMCEAAPVSLCTEAQTVELYACGGAESEWDERCCKRPGCTSSSDCSEGETCKAVGTRVFWDCWPTPGDTCDCGGTLGGPDRLVCMPE